jgi:hypothetical protein
MRTSRELSLSAFATRILILDVFSITSLVFGKGLLATLGLLHAISFDLWGLISM